MSKSSQTIAPDHSHQLAGAGGVYDEVSNDMSLSLSKKSKKSKKRSSSREFDD